MVELARLDITVRQEQAARATKEVKKNLNEAGEAAERAGRRIQGSFDRMKDSIFSVKSALGGLAVGLAFREVVSTIANFERTMSGVRAVSGATGAEFAALEQKARDLGNTTMFSASQAAEGMQFLAQAGFKTNQVLTGIGPSLQLAQAGMLELSEAADISSNILSTFGLEASRLGEVGDILAATASNSNTNIRQMAEAIKYAGPVANNVGIQLNELSAAVGVLGDSGLQASLAGTGLRQSLLALVSPTKTALKTIGDLGLSIGDLDPTTHSLTEVMKTLAGANLQAGDAAAIFGARAAGAVLTLTNNIPRLEEMVSVTGNANGALEEMASVMEDNLYGALKNLGSAMEGLMLQAGEEGLSGALRTTVDGLADFVRALSGTLDHTEEGAEAMYTAADAAKVLGIALTGLVVGRVTAAFVSFASETIMAATALRGMTAAQIALNGAMLANPITIAATALAALAGAVYVFSNDTRDAAAAQDSYNKAIGEGDAALQTYQNSLSDTTGKLAELSKEQARVALYLTESSIEDNIREMEKYGETVDKIFTDNSASVLGFRKELDLLSDPTSFQLFIGTGGLDSLPSRLNDVQREVAELFTAFDQTGGDIDSLISRLIELGEKSEGSVKAGLERMVEGLLENRDAYVETQKQVDNLTERQKTLQSVLDGTYQITEENEAANDNLAAQLLLTADAMDILSDAGLRAASATEQGAAKANSAAEALKAFEEMANQATMSKTDRAIAAIEQRRDELIAQLQDVGADADAIALANTYAATQIAALRTGANSLGKTIGGLMSSAGSGATEAIPPVSELRDKYGELALAARDALAAQQALAEVNLRTGLGELGDAALDLSKSLDFTNTQMVTLRTLSTSLGTEESLNSAGNNALRLANLIKNAAGGLSNMDEATRQVYNSLTEGTLQAGSLQRNMDNAGQSTANASAGAYDLTNQIGEAARMAAVLTANLDAVPAAIVGIAQEFNNTMTSLEQTNAALTYQMEEGLSAQASRLKAARDRALEAASVEGASPDQLSAIGSEFDRQIEMVDQLAKANKKLSLSISERDSKSTGSSRSSSQAAEFSNLRNEMEMFDALLKSHLISQEDWARIQGVLNNALSDGTISLQEWQQALATSTDSESLYAERKKELNDQLEAGNITQEQHEALLQRIHPLYEQSIELVKELNGVSDEQAVKQATINQMYEDGLITLDEYTQAIGKLNTKSQENMTTMDRLADGAADAFTNAVGDMLKGNKSFDEAIQGLIGSIQDLVIELLVLEPLKAGLKGLFSGGGGGSGLFGSIGNWFSGLFTAHEGGIAGQDGQGVTTYRGATGLAAEILKKTLKPDEELSVLRKGEEVLTRDDPRHVRNFQMATNDNNEPKQVIGTGTIKSFLAGLPIYHDGGVVGQDYSPNLDFYHSNLSQQTRSVSSSNKSEEARTNRPVVVNMNITTPDAQGFRRSQGQVASETAAAIERAKRYS